MSEEMAEATEQTADTDTNYDQQSQEIPQQNWWNSLPQELQIEASKFNSVDDLVKGYLSAKNLVGKKVEDFSKSDFDTYSSMMEEFNNIPQSADGYEIELRQADDEGFNTCSENDIKILKDWAKEAGFSQKQAQFLYDKLNDVGINLQQDMEKYNTQLYQNSLEQLGKLWGDNYESKLQALDSCVNDLLPKLTGFSSDQIIDELRNSNAYCSPVLMSILAAFGELNTEKGSIGYSNISPMDANTRIEQMKADPSIRKILTDSSDPQHQQIINEFRYLIGIRDGTNQTA